LKLPGISAKVKTAALLNGTKIGFAQDAKSLKISFPQDKIDSIATIAVLTMDRNVSSLAPIIPFSATGSVAYAKTASASSSVGQFYHDPGAAFDDNPKTSWKVGRKKDINVDKIYGKNIHYLSDEVLALYEPTGWLEVDLGKPETVGKIKLGETKKSGSEIRKFQVQYLNGGNWVTIAEDSKMNDWILAIKPVKAQKFRLVIQDYYRYFGVNEFELFPPDK
jgi:alpha-L-fucosidase